MDQESSDEAPPTIASEWSANLSVASSAAKQAKADIALKDKLIKETNDKLKLSQERCAALQSKLNASKKRAREPAAEPQKQQATPVPSKKPSPAPKEAEASFLNLSAISNAADCGNSSDESEPPELEPTPPAAPTGADRDTLYEGLNSVLCAYKANNLTPNKKGLTYELCAELCHEEREASKKWSKKEKAKYQPMIHSALKLIFPSAYARGKWSSHKVLSTPDGAANYWRIVLNRRANIWKEAGEKAKATKEAYLTPLKQRIRAKIKAREKQRLGLISTPLSTPHSGTKASPISINASSSDSSSDEDGLDSTTRDPAKPTPLAPGPETYTSWCSHCHTTTYA